MHSTFPGMQVSKVDIKCLPSGNSQFIILQHEMCCDRMWTKSQRTEPHTYHSTKSWSETDRGSNLSFSTHRGGLLEKASTFLKFILPKCNTDVVLFIIHTTLGRWLINISWLSSLDTAKDNWFALRAEQIMGQGVKERAELRLAL